MRLSGISVRAGGGVACSDCDPDEGNAVKMAKASRQQSELTTYMYLHIMCSQKRKAGNAGGYSRFGRLNFGFSTKSKFTDLELFTPIAASDLICVGLTSGFAEKLSNETKKCIGLFLVQGVRLGGVP